MWGSVPFESCLLRGAALNPKPQRSESESCRARRIADGLEVLRGLLPIELGRAVESGFAPALGLASSRGARSARAKRGGGSP